MIEPADLTRLQRMFLGTDGTVTHMLEAYADEPVEVVKLLQDYDISKPADELLDVLPESKVLRRRVLLRGRRTRRVLLYAEVTVAPERVDPAFLDGMLTTDKPVGRLLAEHRTETFREILVAGREPAGPCAPHFGVDTAAVVIFRTYRVVSHARPILLITEKFPESFFVALPE